LHRLVFPATLSSDKNNNVRYLRTPFALLLLLLSTTLAHSADTKEQKQAAGVKAANTWIALLDNGKYGDAWKQLSPSQQPSGSKDKWQSDVSRYRKQIGKLHDRKIMGAAYTTQLPGGGEPGEYVIVTFLSSYERLGSAVEVVVSQLLPDGTWVISGYSIRPADATE
jgi:hypothetical protein